jgi:hypothetical protein
MIKSITCRVGATEWELLRVEQRDFKEISKQQILGLPVYYRVVPLDEIECQTCGGSGFDSQGTGYSNVCGTCGGQKALGPEYEVWPLPAEGVEVIPSYDED